ncbi:MAG TPA: TolC family protein [Gemmataceae bacterium]|nr:TolC family protein [Gemmataceae bacterium]
MVFPRMLRLALLSAVVLAGLDRGAAQEKPPRPLPERLQIPPEVPGAEAPPIRLPPADPKNLKEREEAINRLFPPLPPLAPDVVPAPGPDGRPLSLDQLQRLALDNSPVIRQASADVAAAHGAAVQAGLYPNPVAGYQADQVGTADTAGLQGGFLEQTIVTAGKLTLARAAAWLEVRNAEVALRRARIDVFTQVRAAYFAVLVAQENVRIARAMSRLTDEVYRIQVELVRSAQAAPYEPLQLRVLALQARANLVQAQNRYLAAWRQLAAALGLPGMPPTELAGRPDAALPMYHYDEVLARVLGTHTDVLTAQNDVLRARIDLRRAQIVPVPDVMVRGLVQRDHTTPPFPTVVSVQVGVPIPVWDRNQGNIQRAEAQLFRAEQQVQRARNELTARLAEAFARYQSSRTLLDYYRHHILPDQVRTYRGVYQRHQQDPDRVTFGDIIVAQQTLAATIIAYLGALGDFWAAVVDVAALLQTDDLFLAADPECLPALPDLGRMLGWPDGPR